MKAHSTFLRRWAVGALLLTPGLGFGGIAGEGSGDTVNSFLADEPQPLTAEYLEAGQQNVRSVANQLATLLEGRTIPNYRPTFRPIPPDFTVIPGEKESATLIYRCRYIEADRKLVVVMENILRTGYVEVHPEQNLIVINDQRTNIDNLKKALLTIDKPTPQVLVEIKVVEVLFVDSMQRNLSVNYNDGKMGKTADGKDKSFDSTAGAVNNALGSSTSSGLNLDWFPYVSGARNLQTTFQWVLSGQNAKILSSPNLVISRNEEATFASGQDIPIQELSTTSSGTNIATSFRRVGVTLTLTPVIINDDLVTLRVAPEVSNVQQYQKITQGYDSTTNQAVTYQVPVISVRNVDTTLTLHDGEVIMMGGLYNNRTSIQEDRTPFLCDIPILGEFFTAKYREQELIQLVFFLRVHILRPSEPESGILYNPDEVASTSSRIGDILQSSPEFPKLKSTLQQVKEEFFEVPEERLEGNQAVAEERAQSDARFEQNLEQAGKVQDKENVKLNFDFDVEPTVFPAPEVPEQTPVVEKEPSAPVVSPGSNSGSSGAVEEDGDDGMGGDEPALEDGSEAEDALSPGKEDVSARRSTTAAFDLTRG